MHLPDFRASVTCVRVPVYRAHSVAISAEFERPVSLDRAREVLAKAPGLELVDEPHANRYPMPLYVAGQGQLPGGPSAARSSALRMASPSGFRVISCLKAPLSMRSRLRSFYKGIARSA